MNRGFRGFRGWEEGRARASSSAGGESGAAGLRRAQPSRGCRPTYSSFSTSSIRVHPCNPWLPPLRLRRRAHTAVLQEAGGYPLPLFTPRNHTTFTWNIPQYPTHCIKTSCTKSALLQYQMFIMNAPCVSNVILVTLCCIYGDIVKARGGRSLT